MTTKNIILIYTYLEQHYGKTPNAKPNIENQKVDMDFCLKLIENCKSDFVLDIDYLLSVWERITRPLRPICFYGFLEDFNLFGKYNAFHKQTMEHLICHRVRSEKELKQPLKIGKTICYFEVLPSQSKWNFEVVNGEPGTKQDTKGDWFITKKWIIETI
jgi:hypothetical protein